MNLIRTVMPAGFVACAISAIAVAVAVVSVPAMAQQGAATVQVDAVKQEPLSQTMPVIGRFVATQAGVVASLMRGPVASVSVAVGDRVKKGDVVARLAAERIRWSRELAAANLKSKEAGLRTAKAQLALTQQELDRLGNLRKSAAFSQARFEDKQSEVTKFRSEVGEHEADVASAAAELRLAEIDMYNSEIRAPYNAVVAEKHTVAGAYLNVGDPVVTLISEEGLEIEANVPSERIGGLAPGRDVDVQLDNGAVKQATVRALVPAESTLTRTRPVRFTAAFTEERDNGVALAANQSVTVLVPIGRPRDVVSVHKDAVIPRAGQNIVFVVEGGKAMQRAVQLGSAVGNRLEVLGGLNVGDVTVVRGNERLFPGQPVTYQGMPQAAGDAPAGGKS
jgi:RND family efflux transporter MFP subunit